MRTILIPYKDWNDSSAAFHSADLDKAIQSCVTVLDYFHEMDEAPESIEQGDEKWDGYEVYLASYLLELCEEWERRTGRAHSLADRADFHFECERESGTFDMEFPNWLLNDEWRKQDRSLLFKANPDYYIELFQADGKKV